MLPVRRVGIGELWRLLTAEKMEKADVLGLAGPGIANGHLPVNGMTNGFANGAKRGLGGQVRSVAR